MSELDRIRARKGASRIADIPADVLEALEAGTVETITLVEWLAIDARKLLLNVLDDVGLSDHRERLDNILREATELGVSRRQKVIGVALHDATRGRPKAFEKLATHPSDMVRAWAAFAVAANEILDFDTRLDRMESFAADRSASTRECAWDAWRPWFVRDVTGNLPKLQRWVESSDENVRRCGVEGTRPCGVWTMHIPELKAEPWLAADLLEPVRSDPSRYVQNAVANWLNDASKSQPAWVVETTDRWTADSGTPETEYIVRRALRTLHKRAAVLAVAPSP